MLITAGLASTYATMFNASSCDAHSEKLPTDSLWVRPMIDRYVHDTHVTRVIDMMNMFVPPAATWTG